jgi:anaerobic selenocysteine-containing dehydrogenase
VAVRGRGCLHISADIFQLDKTLIEGLDVRDNSVRMLDQSRIGAILTGEMAVLQGGGPVHALIVQNTNPVSVAPDQTKVKRGFARDDLFVCVHEQFMTETAQMADVVLPATTFLEHDDIYRGGGHQYLILGPKLVEPPGECRNNHEVISRPRQAWGARHAGSEMSPRQLIDHRCCGFPNAARWRRSRLTVGSIASLHSANRIIWTVFLARWQIPLQTGLAERAVSQPI